MMYFYIHGFFVSQLWASRRFCQKVFLCEFFLIEVKVLLPRSKFGVAVAPSKKKTAQVGKNASQNIKQYVDVESTLWIGNNAFEKYKTIRGPVIAPKPSLPLLRLSCWVVGKGCAIEPIMARSPCCNFCISIPSLIVFVFLSLIILMRVSAGWGGSHYLGWKILPEGNPPPLLYSHHCPSLPSFHITLRYISLHQNTLHYITSTSTPPVLYTYQSLSPPSPQYNAAVLIHRWISAFLIHSLIQTQNYYNHLFILPLPMSPTLWVVLFFVLQCTILFIISAAGYFALLTWGHPETHQVSS